jgi:hypothetical protein
MATAAQVQGREAVERKFGFTCSKCGHSHVMHMPLDEQAITPDELAMRSEPRLGYEKSLVQCIASGGYVEEV